MVSVDSADSARPNGSSFMSHVIRFVGTLLPRIRGRVESPARGTSRFRLVILVGFAISNLGIPVGDWQVLAKSPPARISIGCRCSSSAKLSGRCCCAKSPAASLGKSCCTAKRRPTASTAPRFCCAKKMLGAPTPAEAASDENPNWRSGCLCGPSDGAMLLLCAQPRVLSSVISFDALQVDGESRRATSCVVCGERPRPQVPPPRFSTV